MTKLIVHAPTVAALHRAQRNLVNLLAAEPDATVELVVNGEAAIEAIDSPNPTTGGYVVLCENSLRAAGRQEPRGFRTVPAAIHYIAQRQAEGWSYFRA
jgi:intracellular sulfur oxidation DsrE/DsrF family protein